MTADARSIPVHGRLRAIHLSPAGHYTRYMLGGYLRRVFIVTSVLLAIGLTIDLWPQFHLVANSSGRGGLIAIWHVLRFAGLRAPDIVAPFLPFAIFLGVVWTEVTNTQSGERILVWNSGRPPLFCLTPVILLGVILGAVELTLDAYLGPAAMGVQMRERLGLDGQRLDRTRRGDDHWIALPSGLLRAQIEYGPPSILHHLMYCKRDATGQLAEVDTAMFALRLSNSNQWLLRDGRSWMPERNPEDDTYPIFSTGNAANVTTVPFTRRIVTLELDPLWLSVFGMEPQYLPMPVLRALTQSKNRSLPKALFSTRLQVLYGETVLPGGMALLAASLSMLFLAYRIPLKALVGVVFAGYIAHFGAKACILMGQNGYVPPIVAGWFAPAVLFGATLAVLHLIAKQSRSVSH